MRRAPSLLVALALSSLIACGSDPNEAGTDGNDGTPGLDGQQGADGSDGSAGKVGEAGEKGKTSLVRLDDEPTGPNCPHGGTAVKSGVDLNDNGVLEDDEVTSTQYVCSGGVVGDVTISSAEGVQALAGVRHIVGMLTIEGGLTGEVVLPDIEVVEGEIRVLGALGGLKMPKLKRAGGVMVMRANDLVSIELPQLVEVGARIWIGNNPALETIGLGALTTMGGLFVGDNSALETLTLPSLLEIGAVGLTIGQYESSSSSIPNPALKTISAPKLKTIKGGLTVQANKALETLDLGALELVEGELTIGNYVYSTSQHGNESLATLSLPALESVGKKLRVQYLPRLASLHLNALTHAEGASFNALPLLTSLALPALSDGALYIYSNDNLETVSAPVLASGGVQVSDNALLETVSFPSLSSATFLSFTGPALKSFNLPLVTSLTESLFIGGLPAITELNLPFTSIGGQLGIYGMPALTKVEMPDLEHIGGDLDLDGNLALTRADLPSLVSIGKNLDIANNEALEFFEFPELASIGGEVAIASMGGVQNVVKNPVLRSFKLPKLVSIGTNLRIGFSLNGSNAALETFELPLLASIGGHLQIGYRYASQANPVLASFNLASLRKVGGTEFSFYDNPKLPTCLAENLYSQLDAPRPANKTISGNLGACP